MFFVFQKSTCWQVKPASKPESQCANPTPTPVESRPRCVRPDLTRCEEYRNYGYCTGRHVGYMRTNCPYVCGFCVGGSVATAAPVPLCTRPDNSNCKSYRSMQYCAQGRQFEWYMKPNCAKTCGFCAGGAINAPTATLSPFVSAPRCNSITLWLHDFRIS